MLCTIKDIRDLTGTNLADDIIGSIIGEATGQVSSYLAAGGMGCPVSPETHTAAISIAKSLILDRGLHTGDYQATSGDWSSGVDVSANVKSLREMAFKSLDLYISRQVAATVPRKKYLMATR